MPSYKCVTADESGWSGSKGTLQWGGLVTGGEGGKARSVAVGRLGGLKTCRGQTPAPNAMPVPSLCPGAQVAGKPAGRPLLGGYILSACFSSVKWALFASQQTGVLSPALPTPPPWVFTLWVSRWPFISSLLSHNSMNVTKWQCSLHVSVYMCASSYVCIYRFHWSMKLMFTNHKMLFWYFRVNTLFYLFLTYLDFSAAKAVFKSVYFKKMNVQSYSFLSFFLSVLPVWPLAHFSLVWKKTFLARDWLTLLTVWMYNDSPVCNLNL